MSTNCTRCCRSYEAGSEEQANEPGRLCGMCHGGDRLVAAAQTVRMVAVPGAPDGSLLVSASAMADLTYAVKLMKGGGDASKDFIKADAGWGEALAALDASQLIALSHGLDGLRANLVAGSPLEGLFADLAGDIQAAVEDFARRFGEAGMAEGGR